jgi:23S rRNA (guanosine2251-2'-O)-methyltransferase
VVLDGVEDPHNLGAIIRTAHAAGAGGIIIPERRAAGVTDVVAKAAAGAHRASAGDARRQHQPHARRSEGERGYWIYGLDERGAEIVRSSGVFAPLPSSSSAAKARASTSR